MKSSSAAAAPLLLQVLLLLCLGAPPSFGHAAPEEGPQSDANPRAGSDLGTRSRDSRLVFAMVPKGVHPYYEPVYRGFFAAAQRYGLRAEVEAPPRFDVTLQVKVIEDLIARRVDGIAISANDDAGLVEVIHEAAGAGIKVITFDAPAPSSEALTYIGTDNQSAGYEAGRRMAATMGRRGMIAVLQGGLKATNLNLRTEGFARALREEAPGIELVSVVDEGGDFSESVHQTEALLASHPGLNAIFSVSAEGAPAAAAVARRAGLAGRLRIAGFDDLKDTLQGIRDGSISFCVVQKTYLMGWLSVERLLDAVEGRPVPRVIDTGVVFVDRANLDSYPEKIEREREPGSSMRDFPAPSGQLILFKEDRS
jgi:ribose transport system substrate-binding protein